MPRVEDLADLVGGRDYADGIRWRVFEDLEGEKRSRDVLVVLGDHWTILPGAAFKALADRILPQL